MDVPIKTSQTIQSLPEGNSSPTAPSVQYGSETSGAPMPVTEPIKGEIKKIGIPTISQTEYQQDA